MKKAPLSVDFEAFSKTRLDKCIITNYSLSVKEVI